MISSRYGLQRNPFRGAPDPASFFPSVRHRRAVELVSRAIIERAGLVLVMGAIGLGKTTVCRTVQERHRGEFVMGYLGNPFLTAHEFGEQILHEFGQEGGAGSSGEVVRALRGFLERHFRERRPVVLFIDEAHLLGPDVLEFLLILSNVQESGEHLLQVVLSGQSEFQETLRRPRFSSLNQRLGNRIALSPLTKREAVLYVEHRLRLAGARKAIFSRAALHTIWKVAGGTPRLINQICGHLLRDGGERGSGRIGRAEVQRLACDPVFSPLLYPAGSPVRGPFPVAAAALFGLVLFAAGIGTHEPGTIEAVSSSFVADGSNRPAASSMQTVVSENGVEVPATDSRPPISDAREGVPADDAGVAAALNVLEQRLTELNRNVKGLQGDIVDDEFAFDPVADAPPPEKRVPKTIAVQPVSEIDLRVGAIVWNDRPQGRLAVIDDHIVHEGDAVSGYRVVAISEGSVELTKDGRTFVVGIVKKF
jgi:general secretion pathway protein A